MNIGLIVMDFILGLAFIYAMKSNLLLALLMG